MWLWEIYKEDGNYHAAEKPVSPMLEIFSPEDQSVNILLRFEQIFLPHFKAGLTPQVRRSVENLVLHYLAMLDKACGLDKREIGLRRLDIEIKSGLWGDDVKNICNSLTPEDHKKVLKLLYEQEKSHELLLDRALREFFPSCHAYRVEKTDEIILSLPQKQTEYNERKIKLLLELFAPFAQQYLTFWQITPCLLDCGEGTMGACALG